MAHQVCVAQMDKSAGLWLRRSAVRARPHTPYTACSSVDRAPGCEPGGRRFKSAHALHGTLAQLVERQTEDLHASGSIPESPTSPSMEARTGDCAGFFLIDSHVKRLEPLCYLSRRDVAQGFMCTGFQRLSIFFGQYLQLSYLRGFPSRFK